MAPNSYYASAMKKTSSLNTMLYCARAITEMNALGLPTFLEPLPVVKENGSYRVVKTAEALAKIVGVASALGDSSRYLWLKLPYCENYEVVARATTLPILLLGGESVGDATPLLREISAGLSAGSNVRGALVGRNVLYPGAEDPLVVAQAAGAIIHHDWTVERALELESGSRARHGRDDQLFPSPVLAGRANSQVGKVPPTAETV